MSANVRLFVGPPGCGKTSALLEGYRRALAAGPLGAALWISPTGRAVAHVRARLLAGTLAGCFSPNCLTFEQLARQVLSASGASGRIIGRPLVRQILRRLVDDALEQNRLPYFAGIAATPGFLDLLADFIAEFKRLEIWPDELAAACGRDSQKDRELCQLYAAYQQALNDHDLYDPQGAFWAARARLRSGQRRPFERVAHVFVDGFTDFTRTEYEVLDILAACVESLTISLVGEGDSSPPAEPSDLGHSSDRAYRSDLFAKTDKTLTELTRRHPGLAVERLAPARGSWPALAHLERRLFQSPAQSQPAETTAGLEIMAAAGEIDEIEQIAARVKRLLVDGDEGRSVKPREIMVVFRSLSQPADAVREVFQRYGIPVAVAAGHTLGRTANLPALVAWLRLDLEDWPFRQVLTLLVHNYFRPAWSSWRGGSAALAAERLVYALQLPSGRAALVGAATRLAKRSEAEADSDSPASDAREAALRAAETKADTGTLMRDAKLAAPLLNRIGQALDALPERGTIDQWSVAAQKFAIDTGLLAPGTPRAGGPALDLPADDSAAADRAAWQQLLDSLARVGQLARWMEEKPKAYTRREFFDLVQELLHCEPLAASKDDTGRVRVLSADHARNLSAPYVFVAGLSEKAFPLSGSENCFHSQAETRRLIGRGLPLVLAAEQSQNEMLLFYETITRATRQLVLSYAALDRAAQPLSPSPYLHEVELACGPDRIARDQHPRPTVVPTAGALYSPRDFRVRAVADALAGETQLLSELKRDAAAAQLCASLTAGLRVGAARRGTVYGPFEGLLLSDAARQNLAERFGADRCWSPSQLEQYARCPYQYFLNRVLRLAPLDEPALEIDYLGRGLMVHTLLSAVHRHLNERFGRHASPTEGTPEEFAAETSRVMTALLERLRGERALHNGMLEIDRRKVESWLADYHEQHAAYEAEYNAWDMPLRPAYFEVAFGPQRYAAAESDADDWDAADKLSSRQAFALDCGTETIQFSGRIDRIDVGVFEGQPVFNVVDYKSGAATRNTSKEVTEGYAFQLPLYALAAQQLLAESGALPLKAGYWHVAAEGCKNAVTFHTATDGSLAIHEDWSQLAGDLRLRVRSLVAGIRSGEFPMHSSDDECTSRCEFRTVCRVNQARSVGKTWEPPTVDDSQARTQASENSNA